MSSPTGDSGIQPEGEGGLPEGTADSAGASAAASGAGSASRGRRERPSGRRAHRSCSTGAGPGTGPGRGRTRRRRNRTGQAGAEGPARPEVAPGRRRRARRPLLHLAPRHLCSHLDPLHRAQHQWLREHRGADRIRSRGHRGCEHRGDQPDLRRSESSADRRQRSAPESFLPGGTRHKRGEGLRADRASPRCFRPANSRRCGPRPSDSPTLRCWRCSTATAARRSRPRMARWCSTWSRCSTRRCRACRVSSRAWWASR